MQNYSHGPYSKFETFKNIDALSKDAFSFFNKSYMENNSCLKRPVHHLFMRFKYIAETTSESIRLSNSWTFTFPALILLRSRLEQLIICSYLIHEDENIGLKKYVEHIDVKDYLNMKRAFEDESLKKYLICNYDIDEIKNNILASNKEKEPFKRKWTDLDLRSMAHKRDKICNSIINNKLEREYLSLYTTTSSLVHSDCNSLSYRFFEECIHGGKVVLMLKPIWVLYTMLSVSSYDILQCYEILKYLGIQNDKYYRKLWKQWIKIKDKSLSG